MKKRTFPPGEPHFIPWKGEIQLFTTFSVIRNTPFHLILHLREKKCNTLPNVDTSLQCIGKKSVSLEKISITVIVNMFSSE